MHAEAQLDMLDSPIWRNSDPSTSKEAGRLHGFSGRRARDQEILLEMVELCPGRTAIEYADLLINERAVRWFRAYQIGNKRMSDLAAAGLVRCTGERECKITGRKARTWTVK